MDGRTIIGLVIVTFALASGIMLFLFLMRAKSNQSYRSMMNPSTQSPSRSAAFSSSEGSSLSSVSDLKKLDKQMNKQGMATKKRDKATLEERMFHAGIFTQEERKKFQRFRIIAPIIFVLVFSILAGIFSVKLLPVGIIFGLLFGLQAPTSVLDRRIAARHDDIMFFLPLVIEQIAIGVSSSLDVGPCVQRVVQMADERDTHNPVTQLLKYAESFMRSGVSFEEAMTETGKAAGHSELKHSFMYLAQVAKHGGEITRQLQELADSVANQRQAHIEGVIKTLELKATGPVALVFVGFIIIFLVGLMVEIKKAF